MVDETLILRKLSELDEYYSQIKEYDKITVAQYSDEWKIQRIIERTLQMMIETCADIASHIIADKGYRVPKSYSDTFKVLHEENIVSSCNVAIKFLTKSIKTGNTFLTGFNVQKFLDVTPNLFFFFNGQVVDL